MFIWPLLTVPVVIAPPVVAYPAIAIHMRSVRMSRRVCIIPIPIPSRLSGIRFRATHRWLVLIAVRAGMLLLFMLFVFILLRKSRQRQ